MAAHDRPVETDGPLHMPMWSVRQFFAAFELDPANQLRSEATTGKCRAAKVVVG